LPTAKLSPSVRNHRDEQSARDADGRGEQDGSPRVVLERGDGDSVAKRAERIKTDVLVARTEERDAERRHESGQVHPGQKHDGD